MKRHFRMFTAYNGWANRRLYADAALLSEEEFARDTGVFFSSVLGTLNHLLVTDRIWMKRFTGRGEATNELDAILFRDFAGLRDARIAEDARIAAWVDSLDEAAIGECISYLTTRQEPVTQRLGPALAHLFNHQTHHRGQAHAALTMLGKAPTALDLAFFVRSEEGQIYA